MIGKVCLQAPTKQLVPRAHRTVSSGCQLADICWDRDALGQGHVLDRSHTILNLRFQSSAENNTQDALTSMHLLRLLGYSSASYISLSLGTSCWWGRRVTAMNLARKKVFCSASHQWACHPQICPPSPCSSSSQEVHSSPPHLPPENTIIPVAGSPLPSRLRTGVICWGGSLWELCK